ncbi:MAG: SDR family oxidoreductase [Halobacteriaceae archaeon]
MPVTFDFSDQVVLVTGASGALGSAVVTAFDDVNATVCGADIVEPSDEDAQLTEGTASAFYQADFTDPDAVEQTIDAVRSNHGHINHLINIAGTWRGGDPLDETDVDVFDFLFDINLKTMFLASKFALPHLRETEGSIVSVSSRSSLEGGEGDGIYRATKAGVRILTETIAEENLGTVRANAIMPSVIDTPMNREMMDGPKEEWVDPADIADVILFLCSERSSVTSGAAVPVYGEA